MDNNIEDFDVYIGNLYLPLLNDVAVMPSSSIVRKSILDHTIKFKEDAYDEDLDDLVSEIEEEKMVEYEVEEARSKSMEDTAFKDVVF